MTDDSILPAPGGALPSGVSQSGRMSPAALALAIGLHVAIAAALWWISPLHSDDHAETPIMVSVEPEALGGSNASAEGAAASSGGAPASNAPTSTPTTETAAAPAPPETTPTPPQPAQAEPQREPPQPPQPQQQAAKAAEPAPPAEADPETTWQTDASAWKPQVTFEQALPPPEAPPPPTSRDIPKPQRAAPPPRPVQRAQTTPTPRPAAPPPAASSSASIGEQQSTASLLSSSAAGASNSDLAAGHGGLRNDYLSRVFRHIEPYRVYPASARENRQAGRVVTRVTINRDGQLVDARVERSSGWPVIDAAELAAIRRAMPLPPVPNGMPGDPIVLILPMNYGMR
ncbi:MAG: energy transducer TonB [Alphaproteobacteria bacterium]|nr:energy transducer TonB [Alphaproteobacteria bacterium]